MNLTANRYILSLILLASGPVLFAQTTHRISGIVVDPRGDAVAGATVRLDARAGNARTTTDDTGRFLLEAANATSATITVEADGFRQSSHQWSASRPGELKIVLTPEGLSEQVTITRTETRIEETSTSVIALNRNEIETTAAATLDDRLRRIPGFTLFRRAGSRTANPTTQGVSLRGIGASGASRALVLADGVPLNDQFGSWVYWGRVPSESVDQIEVLRGPASDLYGGSAVGGVISLITKRPLKEPSASIEASYGSQKTGMVSAFASTGLSKWRGSLAGELFRTDGFIIVDEAERGIADTPANVRRSVINPLLERVFNGPRRIFASAEFFEEARANGTPLQNNDTNLRNSVGGLDWDWPAGLFALRVYGGNQRYNQSFTAVSADRASESLIRFQHVPSQVLGGSGQWTGSFRNSVFIAGFEVREVRGRSDETVFSGGRATSLVSAGGRELTAGLFAGAVVPATTRLTFSGGVRFDRWQNSVGYSATRSLISDASTLAVFADRNESAVSPRGSVLFKASRNVSIAASVATAFRRPTLNELYRAFRVGEILTVANENLRAERAVSGETAVIASAFERRLYARGGVFCTKISRNVANVTLSETPSLITRQRQNLGQTRSCGVEVDWQWRAHADLSFSSGYLFVDSRVKNFPANTVLEGLRVPQIARHQVTFQTEYSNTKFLRIALQMRASSSQFDDDLNRLPLRGYFTVDALVSRRLGKRIEVFAAGENLFDSKIESGRTPVLTLAPPRTVRFGIRLKLRKK